jgi:HSP20 family molecular chaperone IbpA
VVEPLEVIVWKRGEERRGEEERNGEERREGERRGEMRRRRGLPDHVRSANPEIIYTVKKQKSG